MTAKSCAVTPGILHWGERTVAALLCKVAMQIALGISLFVPRVAIHKTIWYHYASHHLVAILFLFILFPPNGAEA